MKNILVIEDDGAIVQGLTETLKAEHFDVHTSATGEKGIQLAKRENISLIILDLILPDMKGEDVCRTLRKQEIEIPILVLSSKKHEIDKVTMLEIGADDYVTKPFSPRELVARIHAILRRKSEIKKEIDDYAFGDVEIDFKKQEGKKGTRTLKLSSKEFEILKYFIQHESEVVTREMLLNEIWGYETFPTTRTVDNFILSIRKQIESDQTHPKHLLTVHTSGYKFVKG